MCPLWGQLFSITIIQGSASINNCFGRRVSYNMPCELPLIRVKHVRYIPIIMQLCRWFKIRCALARLGIGRLKYFLEIYFTSLICFHITSKHMIYTSWISSRSVRQEICNMNRITWLLFTKWTDVLLSNLVKSRSREIGCYNDYIVLIFGRLLGSAAAEVHVKFQSDWRSLNPNLAASRSCGETSVRIVNRVAGFSILLNTLPPTEHIRHHSAVMLYLMIFSNTVADELRIIHINILRLLASKIGGAYRISRICINTRIIVSTVIHHSISTEETNTAEK